jgi:lysophospholipase L1-like esterase
MRRLTSEDLRNPHRIFYQLIREYSDGSLFDNVKWMRARVEAVDVIGGRLEASPPNPANSIRARIYTSGLDATTPRDVLPIFYPMLPPHIVSSIQPGEHVMVQFEDEAKTSGFWLCQVPVFNAGLNYSNPDFRSTGAADASHTFEGDSPPTTTVNPDTEYGGSTTNTTGRQAMVDAIEESSAETNPWAGKRVLLLGDSQVAGPWGTKLGEVLRGDNNVSYFAKEGRVSWGVISWLNGKLTSTSPTMPSLQSVISRHRPDIIVISLGGNDGSSGRAGRADYESKVRELYQIATNAADMVIWSGPPTAVGSATSRQAGRANAARKISTVVGDRFVDVSVVTNTLNGRRADGIHFNATSDALEPWADLVVQKGYSLNNT